MNEFEKLEQLSADFTATIAAYDTARHDADDMIAAVTARLSSEQKLTASRLAELKQIADDLDRSDTVRRVAAAELAKLKEQPAATPSQMEQEEFAKLINQQETAILDMKKIQTQTREAIEEATKRIQAIRSAILGSRDLDIMLRWITGQQSKFSNLYEGVPEDD